MDFFQACSQTNIEEVKKCIANDPYIVYEKDKNDQTGLNIAVKNSSYDIVKLLLDHHSDITTTMKSLAKNNDRYE